MSISPKDTNIPGSYQKCEKIKYNKLIPCPHVRCKEHWTDMAIKDWVIQHLEPWIMSMMLLENNVFEMDNIYD